jgi:hypothetical protein
VKKEEFKSSLSKIEPDQAAERRMLNNILSHSGKEQKMKFNYRKAIPALGLAIVIAGSILAYDIMQGKDTVPSPDFLPGEAADAREDMAAPLVNQFQIEDKHYILLFDDLRAEYGLPLRIDESDIGSKITTITNSVDPSLIGSEVYRYEPAGSEAVVAVKKDDSYQLFKFFNFESYNNNQDEDAVEYLKIYGIDSAEDIAKVQFIVYSEQSKIEGRLDVRGELTSRDEIAEFYRYYSVLKNSSDKYFERLFNYKPDGNQGIDIEVDAGVDIPDQTRPMPPDAVQDIVHPNPGSIDPAPDHIGYAEDMPLVNSVDAQNETVESRSTPNDEPKGMMDMGNADPAMGATSSSQGSTGNALADPVYIRIYNNSGIYLETIYYKNIGFISRHEINKEFADFLEGCIR